MLVNVAESEALVALKRLLLDPASIRRTTIMIIQDAKYYHVHSPTPVPHGERALLHTLDCAPGVTCLSLIH